MNDPRLYLIHITENIDQILEFTTEGRDAFMQSIQIQAAVKYTLQTLAESTQRIPADMKADHEEIDWPAIAGLRNRLVHDYLEIDLALIWDIIQNDLNPLRKTVQSMLASLDDQTSA